MRKITCTILLLTSLSGWGLDLPPGLSKQACLPQIKAYLDQAQLQKRWLRQPDPDTNVRAHRSSTKKFGRWIEIHDGQNDLKLFDIESHSSQEITWHKPTCEMQIKKYPRMATKGEGYFTDTDLLLKIKKGKGGLIYAWSPGAVYSLKYFNHYKAVAKKLNLEFIAVADPDFPANEGKRLAKKAGISSPKIQANELFMRGIHLHYPSTLIFENGHVADEVIVGVYSDQSLEARVQSTLDSLPTSNKPEH